MPYIQADPVLSDIIYNVAKRVSAEAKLNFIAVCRNVRAYSHQARALPIALQLANGVQYPFASSICSSNSSSDAWCE